MAILPQKLHRSTTDRIIFGVCGGIAEYFDISPILVRVIFILGAFLNGLGVLVYVILALVLPPNPIKSINEDFQAIRTGAEPTGEGTEPIEDKTEMDLKVATRRRVMFGLIVILAGLLFMVYRTYPTYWLQWPYIVSAVVIILGLAVILRR